MIFLNIVFKRPFNLKSHLSDDELVGQAPYSISFVVPPADASIIITIILSAYSRCYSLSWKRTLLLE